MKLWTGFDSFKIFKSNHCVVGYWPTQQGISIPQLSGAFF